MDQIAVSTVPTPVKKRDFTILRTSILLITLIAVSISSYSFITGKSIIPKQSKEEIEVKQPTEAPNPYAGLPIFPLPEGLQEYEFTHGAKVTGPKPSKITIDPLTPKKGEKQTISVAVSYDSAITDVTVSVVTDYLVTDHVLTLTSGTSTDGIWSATWINDDTLDYRYAVKPVINTQKDNYKTVMWFRSPQQ